MLRFFVSECRAKTNGPVEVLDLEPRDDLISWKSAELKHIVGHVTNEPNTKNQKFDFVFGGLQLHQAFESREKMRHFLSGVATRLSPGGSLVGIVIDSNELMRRIDLERRPQNRRFDNSFFHLHFSGDVAMSPPPLFGAAFHMEMAGDVNRRHCLVHFPALKKMASAYGLTCRRVVNYQDVFTTHLEEGKKNIGTPPTPRNDHFGC